MAQAIARRAMKKMVNDSSSKPLLFGKTFMSNSASSTFGRIPQNQKSTKIISSFSPLTNKNRFPFLHPSSSSSFFPAARHMSSESGLFAKAWAFCGIQRAEAKAKVLDMMPKSKEPATLEETPDGFTSEAWRSSQNFARLTNLAWAIWTVSYGARKAIAFYVQWKERNDGKVTMVHSNHMQVQFHLHKHVGGRIAVYVIDDHHLAVFYMKQTGWWCFKRHEEAMLQYKLPSISFNKASIFAQHDVPQNALVVDISCFLSEKHADLVM